MEGESPPKVKKEKLLSKQAEVVNDQHETPRGAKRGREDIAKDSNEVIIVRRNGDHISLVEWNKVIKILDTDYIRRLFIPGRDITPNYEERRYTNKRAVIYVNDDFSGNYVRKIISSCTSLLSISWAEAERIREERKEKKIHTGFIDGVTGYIGDEILDKIIKHQCSTLGIEGKVEIVRSELTKLGKVLHICVDLLAFKNLELHNFTS
ncbi:unnamed protein product [Lepeophtheirus salmonis]|uniref:(salmon louse) hypothetical protein n=1 Tax=Lepeophtheirus salmonis TaxID=72036 RepID=A0A7R8CWT6_LEPSM|nr:unnamed protein product [Lepeophtheirus salmonis]CAF2955929.1 unnamed protein product [Lepeophtheirus salmonis]